MQQFFAEPSWITESEILIRGADLNHMKNVLRMKVGEDVRINDGQGTTYLCCLNRYEKDQAVLDVFRKLDTETELPSEIILFQGLPKGDKMEWIVQKSVELGAHKIVPFSAKRSVVKLDEKKAVKKQERWQLIAKGAAEQSGRGVIPEVCGVCSFTEALEQAEGMAETVRVIEQIEPGQSVGIFIGPEGGFEEAEVLRAKEKGARPVTLGKRILRTETAGLTTLSILMYHIESRAVSPKREES